MTDELEEPLPDQAPLRDGYIADYISGVPVRATPEEVDAVQPFSRRLVEDLGYPREWIRTRPQFAVRRRPSDSKRSYLLDIAVFTSADRREEDLAIVVAILRSGWSSFIKL